MTKVTCIIPVYNNELTLRHVIDTALQCNFISELIMIDDFSHDDSRQILESYIGNDRCIVLFNDHNLGKGATVVRGINFSCNEILLLCDADLSKLKKIHLQNLYETLTHEKYDMVIAAREDVDNWYSKLMGTISGERILYKKPILKYLQLITECGNGIEQITNHVFSKRRIKTIVSYDIGHIDKYERGDFPYWVGAYAKELYQVGTTYLKLKAL